MFEDSVKKEFMAMNTANKQVIKALSKYENEFGKDLARFNKAEIKRMFKDIKSTVHTIYGEKSVLINYTNLYTRRYGGVNYYATIRPDEIQELAYHKPYCTIEDIHDLSYDFPNASDKAILYLIFLGFSGKEIAEISKDNLDFTNSRIVFKDRSVRVPRYVLDCIEESCDTYVYYNWNQAMRSSYFPLREDDKTVVKPRVESKGNPKDTIDRRIFNRFKVYRAQTGNTEFTKRYIFDSGVVDYINRLMEAEGLTVDEVFLEENFAPVRKRFGLSSTARSYKVKYRGAFK